MNRVLEATVDQSIVKLIRRLQTVLGSSLADIVTLYNQANAVEVKIKKGQEWLLSQAEAIIATVFEAVVDDSHYETKDDVDIRFKRLKDRLLNKLQATGTVYEGIDV